jgi:hypothetical protein
VHNNYEVTGDVLSAMAWDLRALAEAQVRSLTAMQRCIDDYRKSGASDAAEGILKHIGEIEHRSPQAAESLHLLRQEILAGGLSARR